jgi:thioesterase domain-containing protein
VGLLAILDAYPHAAPRAVPDRVPGLSHLDGAALAGLLAAASHHTRLAETFTPGVFDGDLLLCTAADAVGGRSWEPYVTGRIESHPVPCGHFEMLDPEPLAATGAAVEAALRRIR